MTETPSAGERIAARFFNPQIPAPGSYSVLSAVIDDMIRASIDDMTQELINELMAENTKLRESNTELTEALEKIIAEYESDGGAKDILMYRIAREALAHHRGEGEAGPAITSSKEGAV